MRTHNLYNFSDSKLIFFERVKILFDHLMISLPIAFGCASIIFITLYEITNTSLLVAWYLSSLVVIALRLVSFILYKKMPDRSEFHHNTFILGSTLTALLWGFAGTLLMPPNHILQQAIVIVIIAGITAGSAQSLQASRIGSILYVILAILPLAIWLAFQGTFEYYLLSLAVAGYMIFMLGISNNGFKIIISTLQLRYENNTINAQLSEINNLLNLELITHKEYENSLAQLAEIVNHSKDAIIRLDLSGNIQTWNKGAEALYGYHPRDIIGRNISIITPKSQQDIFNSILDTVKNSSSYHNIELERLDCNQNIVLVGLAISPIKDKDGRIVGIATIERDISERKEIDRIKDEFISLVNHELRTPLTSIKGGLGLLLNANNLTHEKQQRLIEISYNNCNRLINLVNDILDVEKIASGKLNFNFKRIDLFETVQAAIEQLQNFADKFNISIELTRSDHAYVNADEDRIIQVFINLLSNAIKFSKPYNKVEINIEKKNDKVLVEIIDHGIGIPKSFWDKLFVRFSQVNSSATRDKGGTGLGLSISKAILEKHGSELKFTSKVNYGSTFYFELPIAEVQNTEKSQVRTRA